MDWLYILIIAVMLDMFLEYPNPAHPVVWIGKIIAFFDRARKKEKKYKEFLKGAWLILLIISIFMILLYNINKIQNYWIVFILNVYFLKTTFSIGSLLRHLKNCNTDNLETLKFNVSRIVSRDVKDLDQSHLYSAAIESGTENIVDSVIAPLFYFMLFGIYGAMAYRIVNTADAMIGYRTERYEYFGKFAARLDDVLNFIPARILGLIMLLIARKRALHNYKLYRKLKINGMYAIAGIAAVLDVSLEKIGVYRIAGSKDPDKSGLVLSIKYITFISYMFVLVTIFVTGVMANGSISWWR